jgi:hypothetical protein
MQNEKLIHLHGSESNSNSGKARLFRKWFPGMLTPDFTGSFEKRMSQLFTNLTYTIVKDDHRLQKSVNELDWNMILA